MASNRKRTDWGSGFPYAEWIIGDFRKDVSQQVVQVFGEHSIQCSVEHPIARVWVFKREFYNSIMFRRALKEGYDELPLQWLIMSPGGHAVGQLLDERAGAVCMECTTPGEWEDVEALDARLFGDDPAYAILRLTGPFPATEHDMEQVVAPAQRPPSWMKDVLREIEDE